MARVPSLRTPVHRLRTERHAVEHSLVVPTMQWRPLEPMHIGLTTFVGPAFEIEGEGDEIERSDDTMFRGLMIAGDEF